MFNNKDLKQKLEERQTLSRLMDGEWADLNPAESVVGLCKNDALKAKWERYHLIRDVMRNEPVEVDSALSLRISAAIADEPSYSNVTALSGGMSSAETSAAQTDSTVTPIGVMPKWRTSLVGLGIAASVAMVTVVGMNQLQEGNQEGNQSAQVAAATDNVPASVVTAEEAFSQQVPGAPLPQVEFVANTGAFWVSPESTKRVEAEEKLNMFLSQHIENSPTTVREGMLPYSRLVGYDEAVPAQFEEQ